MGWGYAMITEQQARAIAFLASNMRPHGARRWDEGGTLAAVKKLNHLKLSDVVLAFARAADDRDANTPNVLLSPASPHWRERDTGWQPAPEPYDIERACGICDQPEERCTANPHAGHGYVRKPDALRARIPGEHAPAIVGDLRNRLAKSQHIDQPETEVPASPQRPSEAAAPTSAYRRAREESKR